MTDDELKHFIKQSVKESIEESVPRSFHELMTSMGVDVSYPLKMQQDFAFLRSLRTSVGAGIAAALAGIGGGLVSLWDFIAHLDKHG